ncbi:hypothetical protein ACFYVL_16950 [Streptomyces sp. NPDC004111]|uniref:hypothetical protein n=1 Tax=Streptomyces sp. NPDC004111 TaxID=3364690 RepID=UPI0036C0953E
MDQLVELVLKKVWTLIRSIRRQLKRAQMACNDFTQARELQKGDLVLFDRHLDPVVR